ncbi:19223_t:CDS:2 [Racocetra fulgida]|uniref:19223_t:CDS:1 n=1 Tax=Racocetra fulgida TaxID=60492 RepID=A0A9N8YTN2_9GLOM|nr:19223_t:CDS:2 [Racocetra fulgida]
MTEIKIPFTKKNIRQISASELAPGTTGLELEIQTSFHMETLAGSLKGIVHGPIQDAPFEKLVFVFKDNADQPIYDALWDSKNQDFELNFEKEKSKFASIIKLTATSQGPTGPNGPNPPVNDQQKIQQLQAKIAELEAKLRQQPDAPTNEDDKKEIKRLQDELDQLKKKKNPQQPGQKNNFPYGLVIGGGGDNSSFINYHSVAGVALTGNEIKSIRNHRVAIDEAYVLPQQKELYVINMNIAAYQYSHARSLAQACDTRRKRKLLLTRREINKIIGIMKAKNYALIPLQLFITNKG